MGDPALRFSDHVSSLCPSSPGMLVNLTAGALLHLSSQEWVCFSGSSTTGTIPGLFVLNTKKNVFSYFTVWIVTDTFLNLTVFLYVLFWKPYLFSLKITKEYKTTSVDILIEQVQ